MKSGIDYLGERDPMERQVLELRAFHEVHEHLVDRLHSEKRKGEENSQVRAADHLHIQTELVRYENLKDLFDFCIIENAHFHVL